MGRSKFPGKPSKHVNKKRVNVLPCSVVKNIGTSTIQNVLLETSAVNNVRCGSKQGFGNGTDEHIQTIEHVPTEVTDRKYQAFDSKCTSLMPTVSVNRMTFKENHEICTQGSETESLPTVRRTSKSSAFLYTSISKSKVKSLKSTKRLLKKPSDLSSGIKLQDNHESISDKSSPCPKTRKSLYARKMPATNGRNKSSPVSNNQISSRFHEKESTNIVGKFVLPSRSLHSSRVIKPNKRFINHEQIHNTNSGEFLSRTNVRRTKVMDKRIVQQTKVKTSEYRVVKKKSTNSSAQTKREDITVTGNNNDSKKDVSVEEEDSALGTVSDSSRDSSDMVVIDATNNSTTQWSCGKLVLRKARLQLHTHSAEGTDGPFSSYSSTTTNTNTPGTVTCGVCGAVRFYRFVKQARKFNIYSCESCRKFISKMIKRQACAKSCAIPPLVCHKGQGMCHVPPIVRSQQWKLIRCAYKARCPACWLKMCLRSFQMPSQLKISLTNMLPENMRLYVDYTTPVANEVVPQKKVDNTPRHLPAWRPETFDVNTKNCNKMSLEKPDKILDKTVSPARDILSLKTDTFLSSSKEKKHRKSRLRLRKKSVVIANKIPVNIVPDSTKRQKVDLKGPRVKHVCRSASLVLGQPLATFPNENPSEKKDSSYDVTNDVDSCTSCSALVEEFCVENCEPSRPTNTGVVISRAPSKNVITLSSRRLAAKCNTTPQLFLQNDEEECDVKQAYTISTNYWQCDGFAETSSMGFGLIATEPFPIRAVCFLCGSAGREQLIYCASCCEPYHPYCLEYNTLELNCTSGVVDPNKRFTWTCYRCTACSCCGNSDNKKVICRKCNNYFHVDCLNSKLKTFTRAQVCSSCLLCESCDSENIAQYISNIALCLSCLKTKTKGISCSLCAQCDDSDDTKMLLCGECKHLVHAKCEGLNDETYFIFNYLPKSVVFVCRVCSVHRSASWKGVVRTAFTNGYHAVLQSFCKHHVARELLKWNPVKSCICSYKPITVTKKISFSEDYREISKYVAPENGKDPDSDSREEVTSGTKNANGSVIESLEHDQNIRKKFSIKECSVRIKNCADTKNPCTAPKLQSDENEKSALSLVNDEKCSEHNKLEDVYNQGVCSKHDSLPIISILNIKKKINLNIYKTVREFHRDVEQLLKMSFCSDLADVFYSMLEYFFPWYDSSSTFNEISNESGTEIAIVNPEVAVEFEAASEVTIVISSEKDTRTCVLCKKCGDGIAVMEGRLLYVGQNNWVHVNCAMWSSDVYEEIDGSIQNVHGAISRSRTIRCVVCKQKGASVRCSAKSCSETYHYNCARSVDSSFLYDRVRVFYCPSHCELGLSLTALTGKEFEIRRPVYVEPDRKRSEFVESSKAQVLIGSLTVTNLGNFFSPLSDTEEAIIPSGYVCSRLFWSTIEPWKIVKYTITTSVSVPILNSVNCLERHFTIDHSFPNEEVEKKLIEISQWHKELECGKLEDFSKLATEDESVMNDTDDEKVASQVLEYVIDLVCNKEIEDNCYDEPQNTADLLPPELKDAIFEDLPHDLLDGISMQDIFPKLMSYEDVISMDLKNPDSDNSGFMKDSKSDLCNDTIGNLDSYEFAQYKGKKADLFMSESDLWLEPKYSIQGLDDFVSTKVAPSQELKRSKSEVFPGMKKLTRTRNHQRSCSLTWSCKLDNTLTSNIKKRKVSCASKSVADISSNLFMVVDGTSEKLQELRLPDGVLMAVGRATNPDCMSALPGDRFRSTSQEIEQGRENKCRWQNRGRILQVDGADDISSSASECDSPPYEANTNTVVTSRHYAPTLVQTSDEPVKCDRCQCTYRTHTSYNRHLSTCDFMTTSESDSDAPMENDKPFDATTNIEPLINHPNSDIENSVNIVISTASHVQSTTVDTNSIVNTAQTEIGNHSAQIICQEAIKSLDDNGSLSLLPQSVTVPPYQISVNGVPLSQYPTGSVSSANDNNTSCLAPISSIQANVDVSQLMLSTSTSTGSSTVTTSNVQNSQISKMVVSSPSPLPEKMLVAKVPPIKQVVNKPKTSGARCNSISSRRGRPRTVPVKRARAEKNIHAVSPANNSLSATNSVRLADIQNATSGPTVIIQHLSSPNLMPAYVEAFQHQTGQNLQCIATIVPNEYKQNQYIASNHIVPTTYHVQSESTNLISLPNNSMSLLSGLQAPPTVMGTLIPQARPAATIQCGMLTTEQLMLGSVPTMDTHTIVTDPSGSMFFTSQPVYYGFETIVQNTVMSSQQFMSTALPGVLHSNSSYSATTTQVFQASKIEPVVDMNAAAAGYIIVNTGVPQVPAPITVSPHPEMSPLPNRPVAEAQTAYPVQVSNEQLAVESVIYTEQANTFNADSSSVQPVSTAKQLYPFFPATSSSAPAPTSTSITLPVAPYITENGIPMNIVNPIPQVSTNSNTQISRPMNRVLPMQTAPPQRDFKKACSPVNKVLSFEPPAILNKLSETVDKIQETLNSDAETVHSTKHNNTDNKLLKLESASLKLVFQKQSQDGVYKISNKYVSKNNMPIQIAPIKQTKSKTVETLINVKNHVLTEKKENTSQNKEKLNKKCHKPTEKNPNILYKIHSQDGYDYSSSSISELWKQVFDAVQSARAAHNMPPLPENAFNTMNGLPLLGLKSNGLRYLIEQLPGAGKCIKYKPFFHKKSSIDSDESVDDSNNQVFRAARCDPQPYSKVPYDMFSWLASRHRKPDYIWQVDTESASRRASSVNLPMAMRFRQLKETSKEAVGVYRSNIHGRGLFCLRDIECGEMVIEYAGEVIRSTLTDKREKYYNSKGIGCYMFRVDDNLVVDATMKGNAARFINHSCDPNCYSRVLDILGHKHILIFALRKIIQGEELTYDYKFPFEEDKIPCTCSSRRCRKYLN